MSIQEMHQRIHSFAGKDYGRGATREQIVEAEDKLTTKLSESYRDFLQTFGWGRFSHHELYGLGSDVPKHLDLIWNTLTEREEMHPPLPHALIPIMNDGAGNHYCLNTNAMEQGECPVVFWDHEQGVAQQPEVIASSFGQWIFELPKVLNQ